MFNTIQFLKDYKIRYWPEGSKNVSPGWVNTQCVFCNDSSNHLGWNLSTEYTHCWKCGGHRLDSAISKILGISRQKADDIIFEYSGHAPHVRRLNWKKAGVDSITLPGSRLSKFHRKYLKERNFDPDYLIEKYNILGTGPGETWEDVNYELRIIIPIILNHKIVAFQGRDITGKQEHRYKGSIVEKSVMNYKHTLYNIDNVSGNRVGVVEGPPDTWRLGDGFVSTFGTTVTPAQIRMLGRFDEILFLFDLEKEAQEEAKKYLYKLASLGKRAELISLETEKDPAELSEVEAKRVRKLLIGG